MQALQKIVYSSTISSLEATLRDHVDPGQLVSGRGLGWFRQSTLKPMDHDV